MPTSRKSTTTRSRPEPDDGRGVPRAPRGFSAPPLPPSGKADYLRRYGAHDAASRVAGRVSTSWQAQMAVSEPHDVLNQLLELHSSYVGSGAWRPSNGTYSNPVKRFAGRIEVATAHSSTRNTLSGRSGTALYFALLMQGGFYEAGRSFNRVFSGPNGRSLMLERGVTRDLLAIGAITPAPNEIPHEYLLTGLGSRQLQTCFTELRSQ